MLPELSRQAGTVSQSGRLVSHSVTIAGKRTTSCEWQTAVNIKLLAISVHRHNGTAVQCMKCYACCLVVESKGDRDQHVVCAGRLAKRAARAESQEHLKQ